MRAALTYADESEAPRSRSSAMRCTVSLAATDSTLRSTSEPRRWNSERNWAATASARSRSACSNECLRVLYTDAEITATQSKTVAANNRRSFLRKLIVSQPRVVGQEQPKVDAHPPAKGQPGRSRGDSILPWNPAASRAPARSGRFRAANEKVG